MTMRLDDWQQTSALVLCGGRGTRLQGLHPNTPKPMIPVAGKPFLAWLSQWIAAQGVRDFVYAAGYLADVVEEWANRTPIPSCRFQVQREEALLGTGGGIINGLALCNDEVLAMNGDSMLLFDLAPLRAMLGTADFVIAGVYRDDCARYGSLDMDEDGFLTGFREKQPGEGFVNGGIYLFRKDLMEAFPRGEVLSMEYDLLPALLKQGKRIKVHGIREAPFLDIGLPETLEMAEDFINTNKNWFGA